jgi:hypothetical protein
MIGLLITLFATLRCSFLQLLSRPEYLTRRACIILFRIFSRSGWFVGITIKITDRRRKWTVAANLCTTHIAVSSGTLLPGVVLEPYWNWCSVFSYMQRSRHRPRVMRTVAANEDDSR